MCRTAAAALISHRLKSRTTGAAALLSATRPICRWCADEQTQAFTAGNVCRYYATKGNSMNIIIWLVVGGLIGWAASTLMRRPEGLLLNVVVGVVGAALGGWFLSPLVGVSTINQNNFSAPSLLVSFLGAVILLAIVNLVRRGAAR
jgi:uncharacterized membrane protein YeaQ/YmgE (transglycosylase-associated protein family)